MHQLTQNLKTGKMEILEVPFVTLTIEIIFVKNYFLSIRPSLNVARLKQHILRL